MENTDKAEKTFQMMECGSIHLNFIIQHGFLLVGNTKAGKTTTSHYLAHQVLEGFRNTAQMITYQVKAGNPEFKNATIGNKQTQSQTQIPNFFFINCKNRMVYLVDCPGYLDSYGCYRIISNRFFHYQVFSKVKRIKFIVTFPYNHMRNLSRQMLQAFREFLKGFKDLQKIKENFIQSISIMVTSVPKNQTRQSVLKLYKQTRNDIGSEFQQIYTAIKDRIIQKKRLYIFEVAQQKKPCNASNNLLQQIDENSKFWERNLNQLNQVEMSNIKIQIIDYVSQNPAEFNNQLKVLSKFYENNLMKQITNLTDVLIKFGEDALKSQENAEFIQLMIKFNKQKTKWKDDVLFNKYQQKRKKLKYQLFKPNNLGMSESKQLPFWLFKLKAFKKIQSQIKQIMVFQKTERGYQQLSKIEKTIKQMLQTFISLGKRKKYVPLTKDNQKNQFLLDYAYQFYKNIIISNKLFRLVNVEEEDQNAKINNSDGSQQNNNNQFKKAEQNEKIKQLQQGMFFILVDYPHKLKSIFMKGMNFNCQKVLFNSMERFKIQQRVSVQSAKQIVKVLEQFKDGLLNSKDKTTNQAFLNNIDIQITQLHNSSFRSLIIEQASPDLRIILQMFQQIKINLDKIKKFEQKKIDIKKLKIENNKTIYLIGQCLFKNNKCKLSLQIFDLLFDGHKVFEVLDCVQQRRKNQKNNQYLDHLIKYTKYANKYRRKQLAITKGQCALNLARFLCNQQKIESVSNTLKEICQGTSIIQSEAYLNNLFDVVTAAQIPKEIIEQIIKAIPK